MTNGKAEVTGFFEFENEIYCSRESLGAIIPITIGNYEGKIHFPTFPSDWDKLKHLPTLSPPDVVKTWLTGGEPFYYGNVINYPNCDSLVNKAIVVFTSVDENAEEYFQNIFVDISKWKLDFYMYVTLLTKKGWKSKAPIQCGNGLSLYKTIPDQKKLEPVQQKEIWLKSHIFKNDDHTLKPEQLKQAVAFASSNKQLNLEYIMLSRAYNDIELEDYRSAIVESTAGLEIALTQYIKKKLEDYNIEFADKLLKKYRQLGNLLDLLNMIDSSFEKERYTKSIVKPRNSVVHKAKFPEEKTARSVVYEVRKLLDQFSPNLEED